MDVHGLASMRLILAFHYLSVFIAERMKFSLGPKRHGGTVIIAGAVHKGTNVDSHLFSPILKRPDAAASTIAR